MAGLLDFIQGASNAAASNVSAPVDGLAWLLRKAGVPIPDAPLGGSDWMAQKGLTRPAEGMAGLLGETAGGLAPILAAAKAPQIAQGLLQAGDNLAAPSTLNKQAGAIIKPGEIGFDARFDPRAKEVERLKKLAVNVDDRLTSAAPVVPLTAFEGRPFITSMADRTAAGGLLTDINGVKLNRPVDLLGGQDYMFDNPGQVWASAQNPVKAILRDANVARATTGKDPLYIPWRMAPTGGDFAHMTGETMINYADAALGKRAKAKVDKAISGYIPGWAGVASPESVAQFRAAPDSTRKAIKSMLDVDFRDAGALSIGEARLAVSDPKQLKGADGGLMNIGEIFADRPMIMDSGHPSYPRGVPGQGLGRLDRDINVFQMLPDAVASRGIPDASMPRTTDLRALQMKPYYGLIDDKLLKSLGY